MVADKMSRRAGKLVQTLKLFGRLSTEADDLLEHLSQRMEALTTLTDPIYARSSALSVAQHNITATKASVEQLLDAVTVSRRVQARLEAGPQRNYKAFLQALQQLQDAIGLLQRYPALSSAQQALQQAQALSSRAMQACDTDFFTTLSSSCNAALPGSSWTSAAVREPAAGLAASQLAADLVPRGALPALNRLAVLMLEANYYSSLDGYIQVQEQHIDKILVSVRQESIAVWGQQSSSALEQADIAVQQWTCCLRAMVLVLRAQKELAAGVWQEPYDGPIYAKSVGRAVRDVAKQGRDLVDARRAPDQLFGLLDLHAQLTAVMPSYAAVLGGGSDECAALLGELTSLQSTITAVARAGVQEFEDAVARDTGKVSVSDGTVHPLCAQVLSYIKRLLTHKNAESVLFGAPDTSSGAPATNSAHDPAGDASADGATAEARGAMGIALMRMVMHLLANLEAKARAYKQEALSNLFLMNNVHYVVRTVESGPAHTLLGTQWLERQKDLVEAYGAAYHEVTWMPLVRLLKQEVGSSDAGKLKANLKDRFKAFNTAIEQLYVTQSAWTIPDPELKASVKRVIKQDLLPPYKDFLRQYADVTFTQNPTKYIKYATTDVQSIIDDDLFETKTVSLQKLSLKKEQLTALS